MKAQRLPAIVKEMLIKENKDKVIKLPDFKKYYKTEATKIV